MSTATVTIPNTYSPTRLVRVAFTDFKSRADPRREILWNIGRVLLILIFAGMYLQDPGETDDLIVFTAITGGGVVVSVVSTWLVWRGRVLSAFTIGTANDLLVFFVGWTALMIVGAEDVAHSDGWLSLFPVLISLPYRLGSGLGVSIGISVIVWVAALHQIFLPADTDLLHHLPVRWGALLLTLLVAAAFNSALSRRTQELIEQKNRAEFLKGQNEAKSEFIGTVSHELRTPITVVLTLIGRLMRNSEHNLSEQEVEHLKVALRNADHLSKLITDLLEVTRIERGSMGYRRSNFSFSDFVHEVVDDIQTVTASRGQTINVSTPNTESAINSDRTRLMQVMNNLLTNASKYSAEGSTISVRASIEPNYAHLEVTNLAGDLDESAAERMFEMFYRADNEQTRSVSGTGLGLHISRRIIEDLDGEISSRITDDKVVFSFWVPRSVPG